LEALPLEDATGKGAWFDAYNFIGFIHVIYQDYAKAEMYYSQASFYVDHFKEPYMYAESNLRYAVLRFHQKNINEAKKHANEARKYFDKIVNTGTLISILENACDTFELLEDYKTCYELSKKMMEIDAKKYEGFLEQRMIDNDLKLKYVDIEKQIIIERENTQKANMLNETLSEINREKNEFMGIVAHDLKNPISNITMLSKLLVSQAPTINEEEIKDIAGDLMETSERMFDLVDKLLDFNAIETGNLTLEIQSIDVNSVLQKVLKHNKVSARSKDIELLFSSSVDKNISSDESRLFQVFDNLLSNAIKYTKPSSTVSIRVEPLHLSAENQPISTNFLKVEIQDQGEGIPEDEIPNLFKKFARLSTKPTAGEHSTGLGLSIVKRIVEQLQGTVYCESTVGKGSTFIVELPLEIS
jgi:signal transduction histidine kinase